MAAKASFQPYVIPASAASDLGLGGLPTMLKSLRRIRSESLQSGTKNEYNDITMETETFYDAETTFDKIGCNNNEVAAARLNSKTDINALVDAYLDASDLEKKIIRQVEYYFGDYNLPKDKWMLEHIEKSDCGWFDMETMMTFKRLSSLTQDPSVVLTALSKSPHDLLQIENWGHGRGRVRRNPSNPMPQLDEARRIAMQERTLFVWGFDKTTTTLDDLIEYFENNFRNVVNIRQRTRPVKELDEDENCSEKEPKREFLGSVFISFETIFDAEQFYKNRRNLLFKGSQKLKVKWHKEWHNDRTHFNDIFEEDTIERTVLASGFDKLDTTEEELSVFFKKFKGTTAMRKRVYRFASSDNEWCFSGGVFVTFDSKESAKMFMDEYDKDNLNYNGDTLRIKWQTDFYQEKGLFKRELGSLREQQRII